MTPGTTLLLGLAIVLTAGFVAIARIVTENQTRRRLAEKGMSAGEVQMLMRQESPAGFATLRLALFLLPIGAALMVAQYLPFGARDPFVYGLIMFAGGVGLLSYHLLLRRSGSDSSRSVDPDE